MIMVHTTMFFQWVLALAGVLKRDGHQVRLDQDMHHWKDEYLTTYLDENKFDVVIFSLTIIISIKNEKSIYCY